MDKKMKAKGKRKRYSEKMWALVDKTGLYTTEVFMSKRQAICAKKNYIVDDGKYRVIPVRVTELKERSARGKRG